jgi:ABC-2 type transport system permease protein
MTGAQKTAQDDGAPAAHWGRRLRLFGNPVVIKELRGRMRGARAFAVLTVYLALMSGFTILLYVLAASARDIYGFTTGGQIGRTLFSGIVGIELFLVTFIAPAFTAGAISGERERQTYDLLRTTLLPARSLVIGKLVSALSYVVLLLLAAIPLQSIAFLFGGVAEIEIALATVILAVTAVMLGALGIYYSAALPRTISANVTTYGVTLIVIMGLPLLGLGVTALLTPRAHLLPPAAQMALLYGLMVLIISNPLTTAFATQYWLLEKQSAGVFTQLITDPISGASYQAPLLSPWIPFSVLYLIIAALLVYRAVRRVRRIDT